MRIIRAFAVTGEPQAILMLEQQRPCTCTGPVGGRARHFGFLDAQKRRPSLEYLAEPTTVRHRLEAGLGRHILPRSPHLRRVALLEVLQPTATPGAHGLRVQAREAAESRRPRGHFGRRIRSVCCFLGSSNARILYLIWGDPFRLVNHRPILFVHGSKLFEVSI